MVEQMEDNDEKESRGHICYFNWKKLQLSDFSQFKITNK